MWGFVLFRQPWKFAGLKLYQRKDTRRPGRHLFSALFAYFVFRMIFFFNFFLQENLAIELWKIFIQNTFIARKLRTWGKRRLINDDHSSIALCDKGLENHKKTRLIWNGSFKFNLRHLWIVQRNQSSNDQLQEVYFSIHSTWHIRKNNPRNVSDSGSGETHFHCFHSVK